MSELRASLAITSAAVATALALWLGAINVQAAAPTRPWQPGTIGYAKALVEQQSADQQALEPPGVAAPRTIDSPAPPFPLPSLRPEQGFSDSSATPVQKSSAIDADSSSNSASFSNCDGWECGQDCVPWFDASYLFTSFDSFTGPLDLGSGRGNFGNRYGAYLQAPLAPCYGLSAEGGGSAGWYDYKGTQFTGSRTRFQNFWTAALTQRLFDGQVAYGLAHDWLHDDYYNSLHFSQWRLKAAWQVNELDEIGVWSTIADRGSAALLPTIPPTTNRFRPYSQGVAYWQRQWNATIRTQLYTGPAAEPGEWAFGAGSFVPLNDYWALTSNAHYILPSARGGAPGFTEETWNLSLGVQFYPGSALRQTLLSQRTLFNVADNGSMAIRRF